MKTKEQEIKRLFAGMDRIQRDLKVLIEMAVDLQSGERKPSRSVNLRRVLNSIACDKSALARVDRMVQELLWGKDERQPGKRNL